MKITILLSFFLLFSTLGLSQKKKILKISFSLGYWDNSPREISFGINYTLLLPMPKKIGKDTIRIKLPQNSYCDFCFEKHRMLSFFCKKDTITLSGQLYIPKKQTIDYEFNGIIPYFGEIFLDPSPPDIIQAIYHLYWNNTDTHTGNFVKRTKYYMPWRTGVWIRTTPSRVHKIKYRTVSVKKIPIFFNGLRMLR
jgi:hypothetical protein